MEDGQRQRYDFGKNCVCVGRISTSSQNQTAQIEDLKKYATSLGYTHIQPFFTTESGFLEYDNKIGWNLVTNFFETHPDYRVLICPEISRLSRRKSILNKIEEYLVEHKIQLIIKDINFVLFNEWGEIPNGNELIFSLFASLADSEMRQKKERFRRALSDYRKMGYSIGGKRLFGYERFYERKDGKERSRYRIDEDEAEQVRTIYRWYAYGIDGDFSKTSTYEITKKCIEEGFSHYLHSKRNVTKCLKERAYVGEKERYGRKDWEEFNVEWMLYCVWMKAQGNEEFRNLLLSIPEEATIIENSTFQPKPTDKNAIDKPAFWGCRNYEQKDFHRLVSKYVSAYGGSDAEQKAKVAEYMDDFCNYGTYVGHNTMGKILMIVKKCLHDATEPDINYDLLREKSIFLLGVPVSRNWSKIRIKPIMLHGQKKTE